MVAQRLSADSGFGAVAGNMALRVQISLGILDFGNSVQPR